MNQEAEEETKKLEEEIAELEGSGNADDEDDAIEEVDIETDDSPKSVDKGAKWIGKVINTDEDAPADKAEKEGDTGTEPKNAEPTEERATEWPGLSSMPVS